MNDSFDKIVEYLKSKTKKSCCSVIVTEDIPDILDNKLGGMPYLPVGEVYPLDSKGCPMILLLQVNCKDLHLPDYPDTGILEIFIASTLERYPYECDVRCYSEGFDYQTKFPDIDYGMSVFWEKGRPGNIGYKIDIENIITYISMTDYRFDMLLREAVKSVMNVELEHNNYSIFALEKYFPERKALYDDIFDGLCGGKSLITIGGYADFTQEDPRPYEFKTQDECLFKFDSCYNLRKFCIGDAGIMCFFISADELKRKAFCKVNVSWDCG